MAKTINHKSDFSLTWEFKDRDGNILPVPTGDFYLQFYTSYYGRKFTVLQRAGLLTGAKLVDGKLVIFVDNPGFSVGPLLAEYKLMNSDTNYTDGMYTEFRNYDTGVELVDGNGDTDTVAVQAVTGMYQGPKGDTGEQGLKGDKGEKGDTGDVGAQGIKGDKGASFTYSDFTPAQISDLQKPAIDAADVSNTQTRLCKSATDNAQLNEDARKSAESARVTEFTALKTASETAIKNANDTASDIAQEEVNRVTAEGARVTAENLRVTAESARAAEFATLKTASEGATANASTASATVNGLIGTMSSTMSEEDFVMSATAFIMCAWWNITASPTPTALGQYWWDGTAMHVSSAVTNANGVIIGYAFMPFDLSAIAVYIDSTTSAAYKYKDGAMVALTNNVAVIASQLRGINEALNKINGGV